MKTEKFPQGSIKRKSGNRNFEEVPEIFSTEQIFAELFLSYCDVFNSRNRIIKLRNEF